MDDVVDIARAAEAGQWQMPIDTEFALAGGHHGARPFNAGQGNAGVLPGMQAPAVIVAIAAAVINADMTLGQGLGLGCASSQRHATDGQGANEQRCCFHFSLLG